MAEFDAMVIGGGPAGLTAATLMAKDGLNVALVRAKRKPAAHPPLVWVGSKSKTLAHPISKELADVLFAPIDRLTFLNHDATKSASPDPSRTWAHLVESNVLVDCLANAAFKAGATLFDNQRATRIESQDQGATAQLPNGSTISARFAVIATGADSGLNSQLGYAKTGSGQTTWCGWTQGESPSDANQDETALSLMVGLPGGSIGSLSQRDARNVCTFFGVGAQSQCQQSWSDANNTYHQKAKGLGEPSSCVETRLAFRHPCLEFETHVGKNALCIGAAGGFFAQPSFEGVISGIWSAAIASRVIRSALNAEHPQDSLKEFDAAWRTEMGEFVQPPNTDMNLLLPLMFGNQTMVDRMAAAFFLGESF